jgi:hypothetical protein
VPSNGPRPDPGGKYDSIQGRQLCKKILAKYVTYDPHDYILDGVCPVIDGFNLLATTPTGSGKDTETMGDSTLQYLISLPGPSYTRG